MGHVMGHVMGLESETCSCNQKLVRLTEVQKPRCVRAPGMPRYTVASASSSSVPLILYAVRYTLYIKTRKPSVYFRLFCFLFFKKQNTKF